MSLGLERMGGGRRAGRSLFAWSGGKDSALALWELARQDGTDIAALLTTVTEGYDRISMHGVRRELLAAQVEALGYPLEEVFIPTECSEAVYAQRMARALEAYRQDGVTQVAFGDLYLEDIRAYREERLGQIGMQAAFPLWGRDPGEVACQFVDLGFRAVVVCVDTEALDGAYAGREYDQAFLADLPAAVNPCGEHGEFHTFVYDGPLFSRPIQVERGEKVLREGRFYYCDLTSDTIEGDR